MKPRSIKRDASTLLKRAAYDPKKLALYYACAITIFSLVYSLLSYLLGLAIANNGGLSGLNTRALLLSGQLVLMLASAFIMPIFQIGLLNAGLGYSKGSAVDRDDLWEGFRRWGAVVWLNCLLILALMAVVIVCFQAATILFSMTPLSDGMYEQMLATIEQAQASGITEEMLNQPLPHENVLLLILGTVLLAVGVPVYYHFRMSEYALMDGSRPFAALLKSFRLTRVTRMKMFLLDLSYWWYYLIQLLITALSYGNEILTLLGVKLPISQDVATWVFYGVALVAQFLFIRCFGIRYHTSCALFYKQAAEAAAPREVPQPE